MKFTAYNDANRTEFDLPTRKQLDELSRIYHQVEFRTISEEEACIRVALYDDHDETPIAVIGKTYFDAANRLVRILKTVLGHEFKEETHGTTTTD